MKNYTEEEFEKRFLQIANYLKSNHEKQENPKVYLLGGQPGSGKSGLERMINIKDEYISISGDDYRKDHPNFEQFNMIYGRESSVHTQKWAGEMVKRLVKEFKKNRYNIILEGTLRTSEIPIREAEGFKEAGYKTELNVIAVKLEKSYMGTLQRYEFMIEKGQTPRMTPKNHHDLVSESIIPNLDKIYHSKVFDEIKIYDRNNNLLYSQQRNPEINPKDILEREFSRKWTQKEYRSYKKDFENIIKKMKLRKAPAEEIKEIEKERDNIFCKISQNVKKEKKKTKEKEL